ncbi:MAG: hypothetical protein ABIJ09_09600 [Pseudomonadota bacterium]
MKRTMSILVSLTVVAVALHSIPACGPTDEGDDDAGASDAARPDAYVAPTCADFTGQACGAVTDYGECHGALLVWCDTTLKCADCAADTAGPFHCALWDSTYGYDCLAGANQACSPDFPNNTDALTGCDPAIGTCTANVCN